MKDTGKKFPDWHPNAGKPVMQVEEHDIKFWDKDWKDLTVEEKADYLSYRNIGMLPFEDTKDADQRQLLDRIKALYFSDSHKNR
jgi:hypothetical protein